MVTYYTCCKLEELLNLLSGRLTDKGVEVWPEEHIFMLKRKYFPYLIKIRAPKKYFSSEEGGSIYLISSIPSKYIKEVEWPDED